MAFPPRPTPGNPFIPAAPLGPSVDSTMPPPPMAPGMGASANTSSGTLGDHPEVQALMAHMNQMASSPMHHAPPAAPPKSKSSKPKSKAKSKAKSKGSSAAPSNGYMFGK